jgi:hypothetical protein
MVLASGSATAELIADSPQNMIKLMVFPRLEPSLVKPGAHYFVYFPTLPRPWENHPFSVATWVMSDGDLSSPSVSQGENSLKGQDIEEAKARSPSAASLTTALPHITMLVKPHAGATQSLHNHLLVSGGTASVPILLEGPYGEPHPLHLYENVVLVAGGIGVTPALAYAQDLTARGRHVTLVWASRDAGLIRSVRAMLPSTVDARIYYTGTGKEAAPQDEPVLRPNVTTLVSDEVRVDRPGRIAFFVCGPPQMVDQVRAACVGCLGAEVPADRVGFYEDSFSW